MIQWHHGPLHVVSEGGIHMVTSGTYLKEHFFRLDERRGRLHGLLLEIADEFRFELHAWAVLSNHYHIIGRTGGDSGSLQKMVSKLHSVSAREINKTDGAVGRKVWHQYWDSQLTHNRSYLARLHYVIQNPVRHGLVPVATAYPWCSAAQFQQTAPASFQRVVASMPIDAVNVPDDF